ncbi:hypothetical protein AA313_de0210104 [Arthrobotrys entomopaga]|nr:hypothetical protein AA313_de0210104 [Arthrobotrys entomopaga]
MSSTTPFSTLTTIQKQLLSSLLAMKRHLQVPALLSFYQQLVIVQYLTRILYTAGADIGAMKDLSFSEMYSSDLTSRWSKTITSMKKPVIAAVSGYALGGGCEVAMMADILYCTVEAKFGQPEIKLGITPGAGGSQRLTRAVGKSKAMDIILTGSTFSGEDAEKWGLASKTFSTFEELTEGALSTAKLIASYSRLAVRANKELVNQSYEMGLTEALRFERNMFNAFFSTQDQKLGMDAFSKKLKQVEWVHK